MLLNPCHCSHGPVQALGILPAERVCNELSALIFQVCISLDTAAATDTAGLCRSCIAGPGGSAAPAKWTRLQAELLPALQAAADVVAARSALAGISAGALLDLVLSGSGGGCCDLACTNLTGSSEKQLILKRCSGCRVRLRWRATACDAAWRARSDS